MTSSWCTLSRTCDAHGSCLVVPRCQATPFLGCLEQAQKCVDLTTLPPTPAARWHAFAETSAFIFCAFLLVLVGLLVAIVFLSARRSRTHSSSSAVGV